jgi:hypothetical protein
MHPRELQETFLPDCVGYIIKWSWYQGLKAQCQVHGMVEELERNPNVQILDEACVSSMANKTYTLWECKWLLEISSN